MLTIQEPDYAGGSLLNLVAEFEQRLAGRAQSAPLHGELSALIPDRSTYVLVLVDGLGAGQLSHPAAAPLAKDQAGVIDAPFPTTTTVSWATIATGLAPRAHGLIGYQLYLPELDTVAYTIKWARAGGGHLDVDFESFLPSPNLWERLAAVGCEPITVQPGNFAGSNLSKVLFRGCRFESVYDAAEVVAATTQLAAVPGRLIVTYLPHVDVAAHVHGQDSDQYAEALRFVADIWERLSYGLPDNAALVGTADHGHIDFPPERATFVDRSDESTRVLYGDSRAMFVKGDGAALASYLPGTWLPVSDVEHWWGQGPKHPQFDLRKPDGVLLADDDRLLHHRHSDERLIGNHGGLTAAERVLPLLVVG